MCKREKHTYTHTGVTHVLSHYGCAKNNLSAHLLLISDNMSNAKREIWISFLCRQSLIHWQKCGKTIPASWTCAGPLLLGLVWTC